MSFLARIPTAVQILFGLVAGLGLGMFIAAAEIPALEAFARGVEPIGTLFINAIRMTVVPLVVAKLVVGIADSTDERSLGRLGAGAVVLFVVLLFAGAAFAAVVAAPLLGRMQIDPAVAAALRADSARAADQASGHIAQLPTITDWVVSLVPVNAIGAAAAGAMLPLIVFSLLFGLALTKVPRDRAAVVVAFFNAIGDAMLVVIRWILVVAPLGVFALAVPLAARLGIAAAGALAYYLLLVAIVCVTFTLLVLYPAAAVGGGVPLRRFARAAAMPQAIAFSSRSSLATLPAMIEESRTRLRQPEEITGFFLPLGVSLFRVGSALGLTVGSLFVARLYGVELPPAALATLVVTVVIVSFGAPGIPSGGILVMVPALLAIGVPVEGVGLLLGVDTIPDMFRTTTNITGNMAAAAILTRRATSPTPAPNPG